MNKYELALVISARLDEETRASVLERAKGYITRFGGELGETEEWGKRTLAYEIEKVTEGYYYFIQFESDSQCPNELEKQMRIMDNVLRYLVVKKDEKDTFTVTPEKVEEEVVEEGAETVKEAVEEKAETVKEAVEEKAEAVKEAVEEKAEAVKEAVEEKLEAVEEKVEAVKEAVEEKVEAVKEAIKEKIEAHKEDAE